MAKNIIDSINLNDLTAEARRFFEDSDPIAIQNLFGDCESIENVEETAKELHEQAEMDLAAEMREMVALGWTDAEAHEDEDEFLDRVADYTAWLTEDDVWRVWRIVWEQERNTVTYSVYMIAEDGEDWDTAIDRGDIIDVAEIEIPEDADVDEFMRTNYPQYCDSDKYGWRC